MVADFHRDTSVLKTLTPPPIYVQVHSNEPLRNDSVAYFTLWFGPIPIHWKAIHTNVDGRGFTDTQVRGPLKHWQHTHRFTALDNGTTLISEHIEYEYESTIQGLTGRLFFAKPALFMLFTARKLITRRQIGKMTAREQNV